MSAEARIQEWMAEALSEARLAAARGEVPVAAVVAYGGSVIARAANEIEARQDATAHAELLALRQAAAVLGTRRLYECEVVVTLEPCPMCAMAMVLARVSAVHFGARDPKFGGVVSVMNVLDEGLFNHRVKWTEGVRVEDCAEVLQGFFRELRERRRGSEEK